MSKTYLKHHGILGQKWGIRRYQNKDGSLTAAGKKRVYAQGADGGYESRNNRYKRSIQGAKYEKDIAKNQKKLDKAYAKGDEKKIAKYTKADEMLRKNKDIMLKDLSENEIKQGQDYLAVWKATAIGTILAGPVGGLATGTASMISRGAQKTQRAIDKEEATRHGHYIADKQLAAETAEYEKAKAVTDAYHKKGVYTNEYTTTDGKRHVEPIKDEETARVILKDWSYKEQTKAIKEAQKEVEKAKRAYVDYQAQDPEKRSNLYSQQLAKDYQDKKRAYDEKRNSFKTDEDKDLWERSQSAKTEKERNAAIDERVKLAKKTNQYDMEFLERNLDVDDETGEQLKGKALDDAYRKYLQKEKNYYK